MTITEEELGLRKYLHYNALTGHLHWFRSPRKGVSANSIAGTTDPKTGYIRVALKGRRYQAHRLAWFLFYGKWPGGVIDHINKVKTDNRIDNLRDTSKSVNAINGDQKEYFWNSQKQKYQAVIRALGKQISLGFYDTEGEAAAAYKAAKKQYHKIK